MQIMTQSLAILVPTFNEEIHIERCLSQLIGLNNVFIHDTDSTDRTIEIAKKYNVSFLQSNNYSSFAEKCNHGLSILYEKFDWVFILHADELITESIKALINDINLRIISDEISVIGIHRRLSFMGHTLNHGGTKSIQLRIFRSGSAFYKISNLDEVIDCRKDMIYISKSVIVDKPLISYRHWIEKHSMYSINQARQSLASGSILSYDSFSSQRLYYLSPLFIRCFILFFYKYIICLGFLDGKFGLAFNVSHNLIYRLIVDVRILTKEIKSDQSPRHIILE
ncbi:hypothetical protein CL656_04385 [bacterium]|nr:hypothetical protein [bacterium]|tara:strand:- start:2603 stop:3445 length:843 start_codon:yes stop_codon:yes gene_type:complete